MCPTTHEQWFPRFLLEVVFLYPSVSIIRSDVVVGPYLATGEVFVVLQFLTHGIQEHLVIHLAHIETRLVQNSQDALVWDLYQIYNDLVVKVIHLERRTNRTRLLNALSMLSHKCCNFQ